MLEPHIGSNTLMLEPRQIIKIDEAGDQRGSSLERLSFYLICWQVDKRVQKIKWQNHHLLQPSWLVVIGV